MTTPPARLRQAMAQGGILPFIGVYDVFSATIAAQHFDGLFLSGFSFAASHYGLPDIGFIAWSDVVDLARRIRAVLPAPHLVVDIDDGYVDADVAAHVVRLLEDAGASAVILEDQARPRRCGHFLGKRLLELEDYLEKLRRVLAARRNGIVVVARTDACDDVERVRRVKAFAAAGADAVLADGLTSFDSIRAIAQAVKAPLMFNQIAGGLSPRCTLGELRDLGVTLVNYSTPCLFAAQEAIARSLGALKAADGLLPEASADGHVGVKACTALMMENMRRQLGDVPAPPGATADGAAPPQPQQVVRVPTPQGPEDESLASRLRALTPDQRQRLQQRLDTPALDPGGPIPRRDPRQPPRASFAQARMWFLDQLTPGDLSYVNPIEIELRGPLEPRRLEEAWRLVLRRQESLRSAVVERDGEPYLHIAADCPVALPFEDLSDLAPDQQAPAVARRRAAMAADPFDLSRAPLWRCCLARLAPDRHLLLLVVHHIISDLWSHDVLARDLVEAYERAAAGQSLPELPVTYSDFAAWQHAALSGSRLDQKMEPWRRMLAHPPAPVDLPFARPRPPVLTTRGGLVTDLHPAALCDQVDAAARACGATRFMVYLAALAALVQRYTGCEDLILGVPVAGRTRPELESIYGLFVNTLPIRVDLSGGVAFRDLVQRVRRNMLVALRHQDVPFERIVHDLRVPRDRSRTPLISFVLNSHLRTTPPPPPAGTLTAEARDINTPWAQFDLSLVLCPHDRGVELTCVYNADLFTQAAAEGVALDLRKLLASAVADPGRKLAALDFRPAHAPAASLPPGQGPVEEWPPACLHELVQQQVRATPDAVAVISGRAQRTYRQLDQSAEALARRLRTLGVGPDQLVGLYMTRSTEMVVALLAILKAGGAWLPLEPSYPRPRLAYMMQDAQVRVLLTQPHLSGDLPAPAACVVVLDADGRPAGPDAAAPPPAVTPVRPEHLAYVIYTSGSTGRPKGVMIEHRAIVNHMCWMAREFPLSAGDRVLQKTPISFDASVWEFWAPLMAGAALVLAAPDAHRDPAALVDAIREHQVTTLQLVPSLLGAILDGPGLRDCTSLKRVFCGGEALTTALARRFFAQSGAQLINLYGPTEASIDATFHACTAAPEGIAVPIGRPVSNMRAYVVDADLRPAPPGEPGELCLAGAGLGRGYLHQPGLTAERFVRDPFAADPEARMYRTGDLVRWRDDGALEFLGRTDQQVKVRGFRVELGEIEALLGQCPGVGAAAVALRHDRADDPRLVAYVSPQAGLALEPAQLRAHLTQHLPPAVVPTAFLVLDQLPRLPNGKIDRAALPAPPAGSDAPPPPTLEPPRNDTQRALAEIWCEALGLASVGMHDDFFASGGHSLLAMRVIARVQGRLGVQLPVAALFDRPTVAGLAEAIESARQAPAAAAAPIPRAARGVRR